MIGVAGLRPPGPKYGEPVAPNLNVRQICPNCREDPPNIVEEYSKGDLVCGSCGTILGDRIVDTRSEWRTFAGDENGDDPSRVGDAGNPLLGLNNLETSIGTQDGRSGLARDLQRAQSRVIAQSNGKTNTAALSAAFAKISEKTEQMQMPRLIATRAQHIYKTAYEKGAIRNKPLTAVIAACLILAGRDVGAARGFTEVCKATGAGKKELGQAIQAVKAAVMENQLKEGKAVVGLASMDSTVEGLMGRMVGNLGLEMSVQNAARHIASNAISKSTIDGRNPASIAGGVLFFTCVLFGKGLSARDIAVHATVTESTIKLVNKKIAERIDEVIRVEWKTDYPHGYAVLSQLGGAIDPAANGQPASSSTPLKRDDTPKAEDTTPPSK